MLKLVLSIFLSLNSIQASAVEKLCSSREIISDYKRAFRLDDKNKRFLIMEKDLNDDQRKDLLVADQDACGSRGCEYRIYLNQGQCFRVVGEITGHLKVTRKKKNGFRVIEVRTKDTYLSKNKKNRYTYSKEKKFYLRTR